MDGFDVKVELEVGRALHLAEEADGVGGAVVLGDGHLDIWKSNSIKYLFEEN